MYLIKRCSNGAHRPHFDKRVDLDLLVDFAPGKSLLDLVDLKLSLEEALKRKVDVVTYDSLDPDLRDDVLNEEVAIL